jgi:hypothetical protein
LELYAAGLLSGLAAAAFVTSHRIGRAGSVLVAATFLAVALAAPSRLPPPATMGCLAALLAAAGLFRPRWAALVAVTGGGFGGLWVSTLVTQGLPFAAALPVGAAPLVLGAWFNARHAGFAPAGVRDESLLVVGAFGLLLAVGSEVVEGWESGRALAAAPIDNAAMVSGAWPVAVVAACVVLGGVYSLWRRKRR